MRAFFASLWCLGVVAIYLIARTRAEITSQQDIHALYSLYNATNGPNWRWVKDEHLGIPWNFTDGSDPCVNDWQGVTCTLPTIHSPFAISTINLESHRLVGTIPAALANLTLLDSLDLSFNLITGTFPDVLCSMPQLTHIAMRHNKLIGTIPECIGDIDSLESLSISYNLLHGQLPERLKDLTQLQYLNLHHNNLDGGFPSVVTKIPSLQHLILAENNFDGVIDVDLSPMQELVEFSVRENIFSGPIPISLSNLTQLTILNINSNFFTSTIPPELGQLPYLQQLSLFVNGLTGTIPQTLGNCKNMTYFDVGSNRFTGTVPEFVTELVYLKEFYTDDNLLTGTLPEFPLNLRLLLLQFNFFHGTIPESTGFMSNATELVFYYNLMSGSIPESFRHLHSVIYIDLGSNFFTGTLPVFLGDLPLQYFYANEARFEGTIPNSFGNLRRLNALLLYKNNLHGTIPTSLSQLLRLEVLAMDYNHLTGPLQGVINATRQLSLNVIKVNNNQLSGTLPAEIFRLPALHTVVLGSNCFTGTLPSDICDQRSLLSLSLDGLSSASSCRIRLLGSLSSSYLSQDLFHGTVPSCLFDLPNLNTLHLSGMGLSGSIPERAIINAHLLDISLSHNGLTGPIPTVFQQKAWENFDVSYNKIAGTISADFGASRYGNFSLSIENNRLSGRIPEAFLPLRRVSILGSNLFACDAASSNLPEHDANADNYSCGSNSFQSTYYAWVTFVGVALVLIVGVWRRRSLIIGAEVLIEHHRKWLNASKGLILNQTKGNAQYKTVALVNKVVHILSKTAMRCTAYIVLVLLPFYCVVSYYYGTYTHEYAYTASAAFISGRAAMGCEFVLFVGLLVIVLCYFVHPLVAYVAEERNARSDARLTRNYRSTVAMTAPTTPTTAAAAGPALSRTTSTASTATLPPPPPQPILTLLWNVLIYAAFATANVVTVVGVNVAFVYVVVYKSSNLLLFAEISLAVFKILWNEFGSSYLLRWAAAMVIYDELAITDKGAANTRLILIQVFAALLNNIFIPCVVVGVVSNSCFYSVFSDAPTVTSPYAYQLCIEVTDGFCTQESVNFGYSTYQPPFTYSYLCSSSFVTYYAPVFVAMCVIKTFIVPTGQMIALYLYSHFGPAHLLHQVGDMVLYAILKPVHAESRRYPDYYRVNRLLVELTNGFGLLLTFGAVFPPLGVALLLTIVVVTYFSRLSLGRFICHALENDHAEFVEIVEMEGQKAGAVDVLWQSAWMLIIFSCCFYTLFLFDTLGDAVGANDALWVLFVVPSLPLVMYCAFQAYHTPWVTLRTWVGLAPRPSTASTTATPAGDGDKDVELMPSSVGTLSYGSSSMSMASVSAEEGATVNVLIAAAADDAKKDEKKDSNRDNNGSAAIVEAADRGAV